MNCLWASAKSFAISLIENSWRLGKVAACFFRMASLAGPVEVLGDDLLGLVGVQVLQVGLGRGPRLLAVHVGVHHRDVRLGPDADRRVDEVQIALRLPHFEVRLVLPGQVHVADPPLDEGGGGAPRAGVEHRHLLVELGHVVHGLRLREPPRSTTEPQALKKVR